MKKTLSIILTVLMLVTMIPFTPVAFAADEKVETIDLSQYSDAYVSITEDCEIIGDGILHDVELHILEDATVIFDVGTSGVNLNAPITVADGKILTLLVAGDAEHIVNGGISLGNGSNVIIEGDLTQANNKLTVTATGSNAGIGANNGVTAGDITIRNARVDATGSGSANSPKVAGAGIGTAKASMGNILIVNSIVTAAGGYYSQYEAHGAAIGMGSDGGTMGNITLIDSEITASHSGEGHASIIGAGPDFAEGDRDGSDIGTMGDIIITNTDLHLSMAESTIDEYAAMIGTADFSGGASSYSVNMGKIIFTDITQAELDEMIATWSIPSDFAQYGGYVLGLGYWTHVYKYNTYEGHCVGTFGGVWVSDGNDGIVQIGNVDGYYVDCEDGGFVHNFDEICGGTCSDCDVSYIVVHTEATAATCTDKATCSVCGDSYGDIDADAHDWSNLDGVCANGCGATCTHTGGTATCVAKAVCETCGVEYGNIDEDNHKDTLVQVEAQAKTCTEIGWDAYEYCTACDYSTYEEIPASHEIKTVDKKDATCTEAGHEAYEYCTECDYATYEEIPSNGHTPLEAVKDNEVAPECDKAGSYDLVVYCDVCGEELDRDTTTVDALTHSFTKYEVTEEAECGVEGKEVAYCDNGCGETDEKEIEALTHTDADGDYKCDNGCGHEFEKPVTPEEPTPDTPDEPETPDEPTEDVCEDCGKVHTNFFSEIICFFAKIINFIKNLFA